MNLEKQVIMRPFRSQFSKLTNIHNYHILKLKNSFLELENKMLGIILSHLYACISGVRGTGQPFSA